MLPGLSAFVCVDLRRKGLLGWFAAYNYPVAKLTFVVGKGGVGKTTVACALALHLAARHPRQSILLMSTDPAHSLADMLEMKDHPGPHRLKGVKGKLTIWQIDSAERVPKISGEQPRGHPQHCRERDVLQPGRDCAAAGYDASGHVRDCRVAGAPGTAGERRA